MRPEIKDELANVLARAFLDGPRDDATGTVVDALFQIAAALHDVSIAINRLGNADACTQMGAIEGLGKAIKDGLGDVAGAIGATIRND